MTNIDPAPKRRLTPRTQLILAGTLAGVVALGVIGAFVFSFASGGQTKASDDGAGSPAIVASPTPPSQREVIDQLGGDAHAGDDDGGLIDLESERAFAVAAVKALAQWDSDESAADRAARLAPYFEAGSAPLTDQPTTANVNALSHKGAHTVLKPVGDGYGSATSVTDTEVAVEVTLRYDAESTYDGYAFHYADSAVWQVTVPRHAPSGSKVISVSEPQLDF